MTLPVQIELSEAGIRASVNGETNISVTAPNLNDAVDRLYAAVFPANGANGHTDDTTAPVSEPEIDTWKRWEGDLKDDPIYDDWVQSMKEWRAEVEADPNW